MESGRDHNASSFVINARVWGCEKHSQRRHESEIRNSISETHRRQVVRWKTSHLTYRTPSTLLNSALPSLDPFSPPWFHSLALFSPSSRSQDSSCVGIGAHWESLVTFSERKLRVTSTFFPFHRRGKTFLPFTVLLLRCENNERNNTARRAIHFSVLLQPCIISD